MKNSTKTVPTAFFIIVRLSSGLQPPLQAIGYNTDNNVNMVSNPCVYYGSALDKMQVHFGSYHQKFRPAINYPSTKSHAQYGTYLLILG